MKPQRQRAWLYIVAAALLVLFFIIAPRLSEDPANQGQPPCRPNTRLFSQVRLSRVYTGVSGHDGGGNAFISAILRHEGSDAEREL